MTTPSAAADTRRGILMMLLGMSLFTLNDALGKWLVTAYPVAMLLAIRSLFGTVILAPLILRAGGPVAVLRVRRPGLHLLRLGCVAGEVACFYWAVRYLPLADVMTIYMAAPLIVTALSAPVLGERVGWRRWVAVGVGFSGVLLVLKPTGAFDLLPSLVALAGSVIFSGGLLATRGLRGDGNLTLVTWQTVGTGILACFALPFVWVTPDVADFFLLGYLGVVALAGHAAMNASLNLAPAAVVVPFQYVSIVWAVVLGVAVWGDVPTWEAATGALLIVASGLFVFAREQATRHGVATQAEARGAPGE